MDLYIFIGIAVVAFVLFKAGILQKGSHKAIEAVYPSAVHEAVDKIEDAVEEKVEEMKTTLK